MHSFTVNKFLYFKNFATQGKKKLQEPPFHTHLSGTSTKTGAGCQDIITLKIISICGIMEDVGNSCTHTQSTTCGVTNTDRDVCVLGNLSKAVKDVAFS